MNERSCIVTRRVRQPEELIRFVAGPDGTVVPDLKCRLPGRGCWVSAVRADVDKAAAKNLFARALRAPVTAPPDLGATVDRLLAGSALGALGLARKAGAVALGASKVEASVRAGRAGAVLHALEASPDGIRKIAAARRATAPDIPAYQLYSVDELSLALGGTNVIHAALLAQDAGTAALKRLAVLDRYRDTTPDDRDMAAARAAEDTE